MRSRRDKVLPRGPEASRVPRDVVVRSEQATSRPEIGAARARPTSAALVQLQRAVGNRVVCQLLAGGDTSWQPGRRSNALPNGQDVRASKNSYVDRAIKLWKTNPGMSLTDFAADLLRTIDKELKSHRAATEAQAADSDQEADVGRKALLLGLQKVDSSLTSLWAGRTTVKETKNPDPADVDDVRDAAAAAVTAIVDDT